MSNSRARSCLVQIILVLLANTALGQYWQQYVEYDMDVYLDESTKTLRAQSDLLYVNHSPDTLDRMLMHLYHNAFNIGTIAAEVWKEDYGEAFDHEKPWTGISIESARQDSLELDFLIRDDTILEIALQRPVAPGDSLRPGQAPHR